MMPEKSRINLTSLNQDILNLIIEEVKKMTYDSHKMMDLQLVCKFFRGLIIGMPSLWTKVDAEYNPIHYLERSKSRQLDIQISIADRHICVKRMNWQIRTFLNLVAPHALRWKSFDVHFSHKLGKVERALLKILHSPKFPTYYPNLQDLSMTCAVDFVLTHVRTAPYRMDFFNRWNMPALRAAHLYNSMPSSMRAPSCTELHFCWSGSTAESSLDMPAYRLFIQSFRSLKELDLRFEYMVRVTDYEVPIVLPQLDVLSIFVGVVYPHFLEGFLRIFKTPNVRTLEFYQDDVDYLPSDTSLQEILFPEAVVHWPRLESLEVRFDNLVFPCEEEGVPPGRLHPLHYILTRLPRIRSLSVSYVCEDDNENLENYDIPSVALAVHPLLASGNDSLPYLPLRDLTLENCRLSTEFFQKNRSVFASPTFKQLRIRDGYNFMNMEDIRDLLPADKDLMVEKRDPNCYFTSDQWQTWAG